MLASTYLERKGRQPRGGSWGVKEHTSLSGRGRGKAAFSRALRGVVGT